MYRTFGIFLGLLWTMLIGAQDVLGFEAALALALEHNHDIRMARLDEDIAENNASLANNRYLPTLSANGNYSWSYVEGSFDLRNGEENSFDPNAAYNYGAGVTLNYTLFDGRTRLFQYRQQQLGQLTAAAQVGQLVEQTLLDVSRFYYAAVAAQVQEDILLETLAVSERRLRRAEYGLEYGQSTQLDVLNAQVDLDVDSVNLINAQVQAGEAIRNLNRTMGQEVSRAWTLSAEMPLQMGIDLESALKNAKERNRQIELARLGTLQSEASLSASQGSWWPRLDANVQYNYSGSDNPNGAFVIGQALFGPQAGLNLTWDLFNGQSQTQIQNARIVAEQQAIAQESSEMQVETDLRNAHARYEEAAFVRQAQERSVNTAERNFMRSEEALKNGQLTALEFRQAQVNLLNARLLELQAGFDLKNAEMNLLSLMGALVK